MARNNARFFVDDSYFIDFDTSFGNNNIITIGNLKYAVNADGSDKNPIYCSFRGQYLKQVTTEQLDISGNEDCFAYVNSNGDNQIKLAVSKVTVTNVEEAIKYIRGMLVDYQLAPLTVAGTCKDPLYEVSTYLSDGKLVSPTIACSLADAVRKIQCLETNFDMNEVGYYEHVIRVALVRK